MSASWQGSRLLAILVKITAPQRSSNTRPILNAPPRRHFSANKIYRQHGAGFSVSFGPEPDDADSETNEPAEKVPSKLAKKPKLNKKPSKAKSGIRSESSSVKKEGDEHDQSSWEGGARSDHGEASESLPHINVLKQDAPKLQKSVPIPRLPKTGFDLAAKSIGQKEIRDFIVGSDHRMNEDYPESRGAKQSSSQGRDNTRTNPSNPSKPSRPAPASPKKHANTPDKPPSTPPTQREPWQVQKQALDKKFGSEGWNPRKKLSPDTIDGIRALHEQYPETYTTPALANQFQVSPEAIRRILKSNWRASAEKMTERRERWARRHDRIWDQQVEIGLRPVRTKSKAPQGPEEVESGVDHLQRLARNSEI